MLSVFVAVCLISASPLPSPDEDRAVYDAAKAKVGRDPEAHVKLALWCEAHGLPAERMKHLAIAVLTDPSNAMARGLMGLVAYRGQWKRPEQVRDAVEADAAQKAAVAEYLAKRAKAPNTADGQWTLALWCEQNGLKDEARAHLTAVVRLDPGREAAWKRLGYKKQDGRWITEAQLAAEKEEAALQKKADRHWKPLLEKWRGGLADKTRRPDAEQALAEVSDPRAVPMVIATFAMGDASRQAVAVQLLGQIDAPGASRALAILAVFGRSSDVRRRATETLKTRDPRDYSGLLVALLRDPINYEVRPVNGPGSTGVLFVEGERFNVQRLYSPPPIFNLRRPEFPHDKAFYGNAGIDIDGMPVVISGGESNAFTLMALAGMEPMVPAATQGVQGFNPNPHASQVAVHFASIQRRAQIEERTAFLIGQGQIVAATAQAQLQDDVKAIETYNTEARETNSRASAVLAAVSGVDLGPSPKDWKSWWVNQLGYASRTPDPSPKRTYVEDVPIAYQPDSLPGYIEYSPKTGFLMVSCFGAGTLVRTLSGSRAIETIRPGDVVLTENVKTGALGYQPVLVVHHNPPSRTFRIAMGDETIVSSEFHRFWKAGKGWVMARDLKPGDTLRTLGGLAAVSAVDSGGVQPVFNLDVAEDADFFVGRGGALVHDNTLPDLRLVPFDVPPNLATASASGSTSAADGGR